MTAPLHLIPHPVTPCPAVTGIHVRVNRTADGGVDLAYVLSGAPALLRLPPPRPPGPADELWRHTCCEAFIGIPGQPAYREFNFSPSGQWAVYAFTDTRQRDGAFVPAAAAAALALRLLPDRLELDAHIPAELLSSGVPLQLGLSVVVEDRGGSLAYWALVHPADRPDFHLREGHTFALTDRPS